MNGATIRLLIGGSPCTHWSIAQSKNRETQPSGIGWELFHNYEIAMQKFKPDYFLYENNVSAAAPIKAAIKASLGVDAGTAEYIEINSALVSAQTLLCAQHTECQTAGRPRHPFERRYRRRQEFSR